jgi:hypothetical protein
MEAQFIQATRSKLRFDSVRGQLTVEDLWDLPLTSAVAGKPNLDDIARQLNRQLKNDDGDVSFVTPAAKQDNGDTLRFEIIKQVIEVKVAERNAATEAASKREKKQKILAILAAKEDNALENQSPEDLRKLLDTL